MNSLEMMDFRNLSSEIVVTSPNYSYVFSFEKSFDPARGRQWMVNNWHQAYYFIAAYVLMIFGGKAFMKNRQRYELRGVLTIWNLFLALFSIIGSYRCLPEMYSTLRDYGFDYSVCSSDHAPFVGFWVWAFVLSKLPELGDTVFIVLRKQKLVFLHWYHHITVLLFCWYSYQEYFATGRWYMVMNYLVHSMMYTYYAMRAMQVKIPRWIAMFITTCQISQMVIGLFVSWWAYSAKINGQPCDISEDTAKLALSMYLSYFFLFSKLFYESYIAVPKARQDKSVKTKSQ